MTQENNIQTIETDGKTTIFYKVDNLEYKVYGDTLVTILGIPIMKKLMMIGKIVFKKDKKTFGYVFKNRITYHEETSMSHVTTFMKRLNNNIYKGMRAR